VLTTLLTRADVSRHLRALHLMQPLRDALKAHVAADSMQTLRFPAPSTRGSTLIRQAVLPSLPAYSVTVRSEQPSGTPAVRALLQLHDAQTGQLLALMDAGHLMALCAAVTAAVAVDVLARPEASTVALLGAGPMTSGSLKALRLVRSLHRVRLFDPDIALATELSHKLHHETKTPVHAFETAAETIAEADVVMLTGRVPLPAQPLAPGCHVCVLGADGLTESPLHLGLGDNARLFADAPNASVPWVQQPMIDLGAVLAGEKPGRESSSETTVSLSMGPAVLDLITAWHVYEGARTDDALPRLDFEA
jgi:ornithine cyclodeaminase